MPYPVCIVMVKAPRAGAVKTRLVPPLSGADAARLATCFAQDWVANVRPVVPRVIIAYAPADGRSALAELLPHDDLIWHEQQGEDLGARLETAARFATACGFSPVVITGTDSPTLPPSSVETAIDSLAADTSDIALAPTDDGGYSLVGFRQFTDGLFQNVPWSTALAYRQTAANAARLSLRLLALPRGYDVDTFPDLLRLRDELLTNEAARERATHTFRWLLAHDRLLTEAV